ncbi:MAG TPA: D-aminoacylase [Blastocatellia bacterium]|nr:D-aminoacylase [Blastocatellia bacterium]HMX25884.1 D-aminoacylase [Blastocatellia bacterium]HMZ22020.1 D-aminoacylase [Blastocatellia bacterium]HNG31730.1 D-aminoacylase [Blastocatellia bacterium]
MFDLLIQNAQIIDGTGQPAFLADIGINGQRIAAVGKLPAEATRIINAKKLTVIPGIIDPHSHADLILPLNPERQAELMRCKVSQGITTTIIGNCGLGCAPIGNAAAEATLRAVNSWMTPEPIDWRWRTVGDYLRRLEDNGLLLNIATLAPHGPIRISAMGLAKGAPSRSQMKIMRAMTEQAMKDGAFGLSTGLIYPPGMYSETAELMELARVVAGHCGIYTSHIRGSSETLIPAVRELLNIARKTGVRVHHSHNEAVGRAHWPKIDRVLQMEWQAVTEGVCVDFDMFPYTAAATMMIAIYPPWALEGGVDQLIERLKDEKTRRRIERDIRRVKSSCEPGGWPHNLVRATSWEAIRIGYVESRKNKRYENCSLAEFARLTGKPVFDAVSDLIVEERGQVSMLIFEISGNGDERDWLSKFARHRNGVFCTDAEDYGRGLPHPAAYGAFPRILSKFVREDGVLSLEEAVRKMTSYPASIFGLQARGEIRRGAFADLVMLDPRRVNDRATFEKPRREATGIKLVIINGQVVLENGKLTNELPGRVIRHSNHLRAG